MDRKKSLAEMRCKLMRRTSELGLSLDTELKIGRIIQNTAPEQEHEAREAKAAQLLKLLEPCTSEEEVLERLGAGDQSTVGEA